MLVSFESHCYQLLKLYRKDSELENPKYLEEDLSHREFVHHKSHMDLPCSYKCNHCKGLQRVIIFEYYFL